MAYVVIVYMVMAYVVIVYMVMAYVVMMAYVVIVYMVYGLCSYGLYSCNNRIVATAATDDELVERMRLQQLTY